MYNSLFDITIYGLTYSVDVRDIFVLILFGTAFVCSRSPKNEI